MYTSLEHRLAEDKLLQLDGIALGMEEHRYHFCTGSLVLGMVDMDSSKDLASTRVRIILRALRLTGRTHGPLVSNARRSSVHKLSGMSALPTAAESSISHHQPLELRLHISHLMHRVTPRSSIPVFPPVALRMLQMHEESVQTTKFSQRCNGVIVHLSDFVNSAFAIQVPWRLVGGDLSKPSVTYLENVNRVMHTCK